MRPCSGALALYLTDLTGVIGSGTGGPITTADLFELTLQDGITKYYWTSYTADLTVSGNIYLSQSPFLKRGRWNVTNTMEVSSLDITILALNDGFAGGADIKAQIHNGLLDGAEFVLKRVYMPTPGDTTTLGTMTLFGGIVATVDTLTGNMAKIKIKGKNSKLTMDMPRNVYQVGCLHAFCDAGCTLNRASFTTSYLVGTTPTKLFLPWDGAPPGNASNYRYGSVQITSGPASGQWRTVRAADATGLTLVYPLYNLPAAGDGFTAFEGCDKTLNSGSGQSCTDRSNEQNIRIFPFVPPAETGF